MDVTINAGVMEATAKVAEAIVVSAVVDSRMEFVEFRHATIAPLSVPSVGGHSISAVTPDHKTLIGAQAGR